eukprot:8437480-Alexandrium_andersonii.AAC.1
MHARTRILLRRIESYFGRTAVASGGTRSEGGAQRQLVQPRDAQGGRGPKDGPGQKTSSGRPDASQSDQLVAEREAQNPRRGWTHQGGVP